LLKGQAQPLRNNAAARVRTEVASVSRAGDGNVFIGLVHWIVAAENNDSVP